MDWVVTSEEIAPTRTLEKRLLETANQLRPNSSYMSRAYAARDLCRIFLRFVCETTFLLLTVLKQTRPPSDTRLQLPRPPFRKFNHK